MANQVIILAIVHTHNKKNMNTMNTEINIINLITVNLLYFILYMFLSVIQCLLLVNMDILDLEMEQRSLKIEQAKKLVQ